MRSRPIRTGLVIAVTCGAMVGAMAALAQPAHVTAMSTCPGKDRWKVKTLSDPAATLVNPAAVHDTTVATLRRSSPTVKIGIDTPRLPSERRVYRVTAQLVEAKIESGRSGDEDIHLVISVPHHPSLMMIAEFPKPECAPEMTSPHRALMDVARSSFVGVCGLPPKGTFKALHGLVVITGVGFFDLTHGGAGQEGHAPHNRELHPVLGFSASSC